MERFDLVSIIETFVDENVDISNVFRDYEKCMCPAVKLSYRGRRSEGMLLLVKKYISKFVQEVKVSCGNVVVVKLDRTLFGCDRDVLFITTYRHQDVLFTTMWKLLVNLPSWKHVLDISWNNMMIPISYAVGTLTQEQLATKLISR